MLVFDVNETLLDLGVLREPFAEVFGDAAALGERFARLLHGSLVATLTDAYEDFASIGRRALDVVASRRGREPCRMRIAMRSWGRCAASRPTQRCPRARTASLFRLPPRHPHELLGRGAGTAGARRPPRDVRPRALGRRCPPLQAGAGAVPDGSRAAARAALGAADGCRTTTGMHRGRRRQGVPPRTWREPTCPSCSAATGRRGSGSLDRRGHAPRGRRAAWLRSRRGPGRTPCGADLPCDPTGRRGVNSSRPTGVRSRERG